MPRDALQLRLEVWTDRIRIARRLEEIAREQKKMRGIDKLEAAAIGLEKLEDGMDHHGDTLGARIIAANERLADVAVRGHRAMDTREATIGRVEEVVDRLEAAIGGNGPPSSRRPPISSTAGGSSSGSSPASPPASTSAEAPTGAPADNGGNPHSGSGGM